MKQRVLTLHHIFNLAFATIASITGLTQHAVKNIIDSYNKPFKEEDNYIIVESKMNDNE